MTPLELLNHLANLPEVKPHIAPHNGPDEAVDMAPFFTVPQNIMMGNDKGAAIFVWFPQACAYEAHYLFSYDMRGADILHVLAEAATFIFTQTPANAIFGLTPDDNRVAKVVNRAMGSAPIGPMLDRDGRSCTQYILGRTTWAALSGDSSGQQGVSSAATHRRALRRLHNRLH